MKKKEKQFYEFLDKYYTKQGVALLCYQEMKRILTLLKIETNRILFVEPSAGGGSFLNIIEEPKIGFDIAPENNTKLPIYQCDFLKNDWLSIISHKYSHKNLDIVFIGNPPFGKKAELAIKFLNKCLDYGSVVGFIVPIQFKKWSVQSKINQNAALVLEVELPAHSFEFMGEDYYKIRCCFQVWVLNNNLLPNLRLKSRPMLNHPDFDIYQYNRTEIAEKYFDYDWDFAVPRQGYLDYNIKVFSKADCNRKQQWIFFKAKNDKVLENLKQIDFVALSNKNTGVPGFGKTDVIEEYNKKFG